MHRYLVYGTESETTKDTNKVFRAPSAKDAEFLASQEGIVASRIEILGDETAPSTTSMIAVDLQKSGQTTNPDLWVIAGWALMFLVPVVGLFIAWYLFNAAAKREPTPLATISLSIARILVFIASGVVVAIALASVLSL